MILKVSYNRLSEFSLLAFKIRVPTLQEWQGLLGFVCLFLPQDFPSGSSVAVMNMDGAVLYSLGFLFSICKVTWQLSACKEN